MSKRLLLSVTLLAVGIVAEAPLRAQAPCSTNTINLSTGLNPWTCAVAEPCL